MNSSLEIVLMSVGMFVSTFLLGYLPTKVKASAKIMNLIAIYGAGLLVGAALVVIIPEGMAVMYTSLMEESSQSLVVGSDLFKTSG